MVVVEKQNAGHSYGKKPVLLKCRQRKAVEIFYGILLNYVTVRQKANVTEKMFRQVILKSRYFVGKSQKV